MLEEKIVNGETFYRILPHSGVHTQIGTDDIPVIYESLFILPSHKSAWLYSSNSFCPYCGSTDYYAYFAV